MSHRYTFHINGKIIQNIRLNTSTTLVYNYDRVFKEAVVQPSASASFIGQTQVSVSTLAVNRERFRNVFFSGVNRSYFIMMTNPVKGVSASVVAQVGKFIYRSANPELGKGYTISSELELEPASRLKTGFSWTVARLDGLNTDVEFYNGHILRNITTLQFTRKMFLRNITQYNTFSRSFSVYPLITYKFNAFTMFCAGMTQDYLDYNTADYSFTKTGYQYFVKLQYLFTR
jgi:hypothetical protein